MYPISTNNRDFEKVVSDVNNAVFSVVRFRKRENENKIDFKTLGSGFFVSSKGHFLTCHHVINSLKDPHKDGDSYRLISHISQSDSQKVGWYDVNNVIVGKKLFFNEEKDAAILLIPSINKIEKKYNKNQPYFILNSSNIVDGKEIGVMGYPLANLSFQDDDINKPILVSFIPRISKNVISSKQFNREIKTENGIIKNVRVLEVSFLFVPGNSGGPIFDASTGEVFAYVLGFNSIPLKMNIKKTNKLSGSFIGKIKNYFKGIPNKFVDLEKAIYSFGITIDNIKDFLEQHNIEVE